VITLEKARKIKEEYEKLGIELTDAAVINNRELYQKKIKAYSDCKPVVAKYEEYMKYAAALADSEEMAAGETDEEMKQMARSDAEESRKKITVIEKELEYLLIPKDPNDKKNAIFEIRAGTGGDEAGLFAGELYKMYVRWAERNKFKIDLMDSSPTELGGFKEIIFMLVGPNAFGRTRFESGTHRVQRVPSTETSGRIHTSAATVAVLPELEEVDVTLKPEDLKIEVSRSSGAGGQHINKTESAVRIVHLPTGLEVRCQDGRSQNKNKELAMTILRARVKNRLEGEEKAKLDSTRKAQIGSGDRSEKIRTYNYPQNRVTDHRIGLTIYNLEAVMQGDLDEFIQKLAEDNNKKLLEQEI
jgi:peptide chain release factor 1